MAPVAIHPERSVPGLRERKKQRTRTTLIDAALDLCLRQGYESTTVEQIANAADVSPRTFSRYFTTKDAVFLTLVEDYSDEVAVALDAVPAEVGPLEALRQAHVAVLSSVSNREAARVSADRISLMLRVINASDALKQSAFDYRHDRTEVALAKRMGVRVDDRRRRLVSSVFASVVATACGDLIADTAAFRLGPEIMMERINDAFALLADVASDVSAPADLLHG